MVFTRNTSLDVSVDKGYLSDLFIFGLQPEIEERLKWVKPRSLSYAYSLAQLEEVTINILRKMDEERDKLELFGNCSRGFVEMDEVNGEKFVKNGFKHNKIDETQKRGGKGHESESIGVVNDNVDLKNHVVEVIGNKEVMVLVDDQLLASNCGQEGFGEDVNKGEEVSDIKTTDVSRLKSSESAKGGLELLTENGVNYMGGLVGVGDFRKYEVQLTRMKAVGYGIRDDKCQGSMVKSVLVYDDDGLVVYNQLLQECKRYGMAESLGLGTTKYRWCRSFDEQGFGLSNCNWPMKNGVNCFVVGGTMSMSQFNHSVPSQGMMEEEVCNASELVPIPVGTKGDSDESTKLILDIFNSNNLFESLYGESGKQGTDGNRSGFKGTFLGYVTGVGYLENSVRGTLSVKLFRGLCGYQIYLKISLLGQVLESFKEMRMAVRYAKESGVSIVSLNFEYGN
ncbi:hypothetical protein Tco_1473109 [Tanacetum coccineum]